MNGVNNELLEEMERLKGKFNIDSNTLYQASSIAMKNERHNEIIKKSSMNKDLVGRCFYDIEKPSMFPEMKKFYKVISHQSINEYRVECLTFYEHPFYWFNFQANANLAGDYYLGSFDFESFETEDVMASEIRSKTPISEEEFRTYAIRYVEELLDMPWTARHYRCGSKLPGSKGWDKDEERNND